LGALEALALPEGVTMITSGEPNDISLPRIVRHLPRFRAAPVAAWGELLADNSGTRAEQLNIPAAQNHGFGTVCAALVALPRHGAPEQKFAAGPPDATQFQTICRGMVHGH
ncbi:MAG: hypothetical protein PHU07_10630, partial [Acidocella sp.]|nr:hypothetical protein [Acidocella sp.]